MRFKVFDISRIFKLFKESFGAVKWSFFYLFLFSLVSGVLEGIGINALVPLFSVVIKDKTAGLDIGGLDKISQLIGELFLFFNVEFRLRNILILIFGLFLLRSIALIVCYYIKIKVTAGYEEKTRKALMGSVLKVGWPYIIKQKLGHLENVLMTDIQYGSIALESTSSVIMILTTLLMYVVVAINISFSTTLAAMLFGGVLLFIVKPLFNKTMKVGRETGLVNKQLLHHVGQSMLGIKTIKAMDMGQSVMESAKQYFSQLKIFKIKVYLLKNIVTIVMQQLGLIFICILFIISYKSPGFNFAAFITMVYIIQRIFNFIQQLQASLHTISETVPYLQTIVSYQKELQFNEEVQTGQNKFKFDEKLELDKVSFAYNQTPVLSEISCVINKGEIIGLVGPSGTGKTTVVDLLLRLLAPTAGTIKLDGQLIDSINLSAWRQNVGYVSQDIYLINDTIANNIRFYDDSISDKDIEEAARMSNIYDFVQGCSDKFATVVGDRGVMLSAGQRQRIVIARVLARKPKLLVLDEATSALDNESEAQIQKVIEELRGKITVIIIAHRLSTVLSADRVLALDKGKIISEGRPEDLLKDKGSYFYRIYNLKNDESLK